MTTSKPRDDKPAPTPHSDGSLFSDGSGYVNGPDDEPAKDNSEKGAA
jgi:hypothetical protein